MEIVFKLVRPLLPKRYKDLVELGLMMLQAVNTVEEQANIVSHAKEMLKDGMVTTPEWSAFGRQLGILGRRKAS